MMLYLLLFLFASRSLGDKCSASVKAACEKANMKPCASGQDWCLGCKPGFKKVGKVCASMATTKPASKCAKTCNGQTCDYWGKEEKFQCKTMEKEYGCDCKGSSHRAEYSGTAINLPWNSENDALEQRALVQPSKVQS